MAKTTLRPFLAGIFLFIFISHPSTCRFMDAVSASAPPSKSITDTLTNLVNCTIMAGTDLLAVIAQLWTEVVDYLGLSIAILCLLFFVGTIGILVGAVVRRAKTVWKFLCKILRWTIYTLPRWIFLVVSVGMELAVIFYIDVAFFLILTCPQWLFELPTRTRWQLKLLCIRIQAASPAWFHTMCRYWVVKALIYILVVLPSSFLEWFSNSVSSASAVWKRQGHSGALQGFVLIPGLAFALAINMIAYILLFLPVTGLAMIWDFFFVEYLFTSDGRMAVANGDSRRASIYLSEAISELDLNQCVEDSGTDSENKMAIERGAVLEYANLWSARDLENAATYSGMDLELYNGADLEDATTLESGTDLEKVAILDSGTDLDKLMAIETGADFDKGAVVQNGTT
jgi:hypothetical protein